MAIAEGLIKFDIYDVISIQQMKRDRLKFLFEVVHLNSFDTSDIINSYIATRLKYRVKNPQFQINDGEWIMEWSLMKEKQ